MARGASSHARVLGLFSASLPLFQKDSQGMVQTRTLAGVGEDLPLVAFAEPICTLLTLFGNL